MNRGDRRGPAIDAIHVALGLGDWLFGEGLAAVPADALASLYLWTARSILTATVAWVCYFAVEPYVRKYWPQAMISWSRLLAGKLGDPLLGRDLLLGSVCGVWLVIVAEADNLLPAWFGWPRPALLLPGGALDLGTLVGVRYTASTLIHALLAAVTVGLIVLLLMLVTRTAIRRPWAAAGVSWLA